jgi:hypothetical protein
MLYVYERCQAVAKDSDSLQVDGALNQKGLDE